MAPLHQVPRTRDTPAPSLRTHGFLQALHSDSYRAIPHCERAGKECSGRGLSTGRETHGYSLFTVSLTARSRGREGQTRILLQPPLLHPKLTQCTGFQVGEENREGSPCHLGQAMYARAHSHIKQLHKCDTFNFKFKAIVCPPRTPPNGGVRCGVAESAEPFQN